MTLGQNHDILSGHKQSVYAVRTSNVSPYGWYRPSKTHPPPKKKKTHKQTDKKKTNKNKQTNQNKQKTKQKSKI